MRVNDRFQVDDVAFSKMLWEKTGLKEVLVDEQYTNLWYEYHNDLKKENGLDANNTTIIRGGTPIGLNPNIRIYRYSKGQYFDCHC